MSVAVQVTVPLAMLSIGKMRVSPVVHLPVHRFITVVAGEKMRQ